jgi:hypothetical protein
MSWLVIGAIGFFGYQLGKEYPEVAAAIIISVSLMTIGFFIAPVLTWYLIGLVGIGLGIWLLFAFWYVWAMIFMAFFFFIGLLMSLSAL